MLKTFIAFCLSLFASWSPISVTFFSTLPPTFPRSFKRKYQFCSKCLVAPPLCSALVHIDLLFLSPFSLNPHAQLYPFFRVSREPTRTLVMYPFFWSFSPNLRAFSFTFSFFFPFSVFRAHRAVVPFPSGCTLFQINLRFCVILCRLFRCRQWKNFPVPEADQICAKRSLYAQFSEEG